MIIATAGHVDHGKTSLVKQLTGVDTDTLEEEKRRGLSINLGFAYRHLSDGATLGFIDVPGHSRFINTMIAGIRGIDVGLLVIAADDGVMPQTLEHLAVLNLLGVSRIIVVISKTDLADKGRVSRVVEDTTELLISHGLVASACHQVSSHSGDGIAQLTAELERLAREIAARPAAGVFRLSVDRAFNLKGTGLVVTGTVTAGEVRAGDKIGRAHV